MAAVVLDAGDNDGKRLKQAGRPRSASRVDKRLAPSQPRSVLRTDAKLIAAAVVTVPSDTWINRDNQTLAIPQPERLAELRFNARLEAGSRVQFVVRPRVRGSIDTIRTVSAASRQRTDAAIEMTEAYVSWRPADAVSVTCGLQNFQWGLAEMMGPSNRIFHEVGVFRDALYSVRGKHLARVNVSAGRQWSFVALAELRANGGDPFRAGASFRRAAQAKLEYTTTSAEQRV